MPKGNTNKNGGLKLSKKKKLCDSHVDPEPQALKVAEDGFEPLVVLPLSVLRHGRIAKPQPTPAQLLEKRELLEAMAKVLDELKPIQKKVIICRFFEGLTLKKTGAVIHRSTEVTRNIESKAMRKLMFPTRKKILLLAGGHLYGKILDI